VVVTLPVFKKIELFLFQVKIEEEVACAPKRTVLCITTTFLYRILPGAQATSSSILT